MCHWLAQDSDLGKIGAASREDAINQKERNEKYTFGGTRTEYKDGSRDDAVKRGVIVASVGAAPELWWLSGNLDVCCMKAVTTVYLGG